MQTGPVLVVLHSQEGLDLFFIELADVLRRKDRTEAGQDGIPGVDGLLIEAVPRRLHQRRAKATGSGSVGLEFGHGMSPLWDGRAEARGAVHGDANPP